MDANVLEMTGSILKESFDHKQLDMETNVSKKSTLWQAHSSEDVFIGNRDVCDSPASMKAPLNFADELMEGIRVSELASGDYNAHKPTLLGA